MIGGAKVESATTYTPQRPLWNDRGSDGHESGRDRGHASCHAKLRGHRSRHSDVDHRAKRLGQAPASEVCSMPSWTRVIVKPGQNRLPSRGYEKAQRSLPDF